MGFHEAQPTIGKLAWKDCRWTNRDAGTFYRHVHDGGEGGAGVKSHRWQIGPTEQRSDDGTETQLTALTICEDIQRTLTRYGGWRAGIE